MFPKQIGSTGWDVVKRIEEYSQKSFTNPSDILKGISGILRVFETSSQKLRHCLGVPVLPQLLKPTDPGLRSRESVNVSEPLEWSSIAGFCGGLCWSVEKSERRVGFPSWSWTCWIGAIEWGLDEDGWRNFQGDMDMQVPIQLHDGRMVDWDIYQQSYNEMSSQLSDTLHISAWASPVQVLEPYEYHKWGPFRIMTRIGYRAKVSIKDKGPARWTFQHTGNTQLSAKSCIGIHLGRTILGRIPSYVYLMVVHEVENGIYERVGFGKISANLYKKFDFDWKGESDDYTPVPDFVLRLPPLKLIKSWKQFWLR